MNKVLLMGRLTRDPETRYSQSAEPIAVTRYALAVMKRGPRKEGEPDAEFINCVAFGKAAEFADKYFKKGQMVAVVGRLQTRSWDDQSTGQKRWATEVVIEEQHFAESRASFESRSSNDQSAQGYQGYQNFQPQAPKPQQESRPQQAYEPDSFSIIAESIDDEELPF